MSQSEPTTAASAASLERADASDIDEDIAHPSKEDGRYGGSKRSDVGLKYDTPPVGF